MIQISQRWNEVLAPPATGTGAWSAVDKPMGREQKANVTFGDRKLITRRG
jgi:hypothetical protein